MAGYRKLLWREYLAHKLGENQYDIKFRSGKINSVAQVKLIDPLIPNLNFINDVRIGEAGLGDNAYIYCAPYSDMAYITGTIPPGMEDFSIPGAMPHPAICLGIICITI